MGLIQDYLNSTLTDNKPKVSDFFIEREHLITQMDYGSVNNLCRKALKQYWIGFFETFKGDFILDYNLIDWRGLFEKINLVI
ncbi:hypothetical protein RMATCC62417_16816 [Rhizopus microsporus]|nr:hypothetical protein RMATCC62417_16816 [Rhizopus microsporus]